MAENYFTLLYGTDVSDKIKQKNGLKYISWAVAWAEIKKIHPDAFYTVYNQHFKLTTGEEGNLTETEYDRPWFDDGRTGWVRVGVTVNGLEHAVELSIMNHKNQPIAANEITSATANNSKQRALAKACAEHGIGLYVYEGEDLPESVKKEKEEQEKKEKKEKEEQDKELKKQKDELLKLMGTLIEDGADKDDIYAIISKHNDGKKNPSSIQNIELCAKIIAEINKKYKEKK